MYIYENNYNDSLIVKYVDCDLIENYIFYDLG